MVTRIWLCGQGSSASLRLCPSTSCNAICWVYGSVGGLQSSIVRCRTKRQCFSAPSTAHLTKSNKPNGSQLRISMWWYRRGRASSRHAFEVSHKAFRSLFDGMRSKIRNCTSPGRSIMMSVARCRVLCVGGEMVTEQNRRRARSCYIACGKT
jgi:hypothetical protein